MMTSDVPFTPLELTDGYLPLERHGLVGDGRGSALVAADGTIPWMCVPRFDDDPLVCSLLDRRVGGSWRVGPERVDEARQWYVDDTAVLVTEMRSGDHVVRLTDAMTLRSDADLMLTERAAAGTLVRSLEVLAGEPTVVVELRPRGGATSSPAGHGVDVAWERDPTARLHLTADRPLVGLRTEFPLRAGDRLTVELRWDDAAADHSPPDPRAGLDVTTAAWERWAGCLHYEGPKPEMIRRSAITLKLLDHAESGAIVAAPTSSIPEEIGGVRNWDYRYAWVRDAAFTVHAFRRIGMAHEAEEFMRWVLETVGTSDRPAVLYDLDGAVPEHEIEDPDLEGYRRSGPVRWGNGAAQQVQNDAFGEIVDGAWQWTEACGVAPTDQQWQVIRSMVEQAMTKWDSPDRGIWEIRTDGKPFTYSVGLCEVAMQRGAALARTHGLPGPIDEWEAKAAHLVEQILERAWHEEAGTLTETFATDEGHVDTVDASLLALPLRDVLSVDHPKMRATIEAVSSRLGAGDGLIYRYDPSESDDGLPGHEGAFLLCSNWLVDNFVLQGRIDEATELFESLCGRANPLGLLPEQIDPSTGAFLGNYPQAFSHVGLLGNAITLSREGSGDAPLSVGTGS